MKEFLIMIQLLLCLITAPIADQSQTTVKYNVQSAIAKTITVDKWGKGDFTSVQKAIDSIPQHNKLWTRIHVKAGIYNEKVKIPREKPYIILDGESHRKTVIQYNDAGESIASSTFQLFAENFLARRITFKNTFNVIISRGDHGNERINVTWAPAALIHADKATFYECGFVGLQDTLTDSAGRHYFQSCYIQGAIDFIWGSGQSIYQQCIINVTAGLLGGTLSGFITAQCRNSTAETGGFVFKYCSIVGTGTSYLGRALGKYSRVIFYKSAFSDIIVPEGWTSESYRGHENSITYTEVDCSGPGASMSKRVKWLKRLSMDELLSFYSFGNFHKL